LSDNPLAHYSLGQLRSFADSRVISSAKYVEELDRRRRAAQAEIISTIDAAFESQRGAAQP
jgi:hypothetical protein